MPFTPTHVIAVVPFARVFRTVPFSALAIGAMVPDLPMFLGLFSYAEAHTLPGIFSACLPLGLMVFFAFELVLRRPLQALLPRGVQARMQPPLSQSQDVSVVQLLLVAVCIVLGAASHVFWDSFTHGGRWGTQVFPAINSSLALPGFEVPWYKVLQHGSSVIGLPLLLLSWIAVLRRTPPDYRRVIQINPGLRCALWAVFICVPASLLLLNSFRTDWPLEYRAFVAVTRAISILLVVIVVYAVVFQLASFVISRTRRQLAAESPGDS